MNHRLSAPLTFKPPFRANVLETYEAKADSFDVKKALEQMVQKKRPALKLLLKLRNKLVKRFGFKTDLEGDAQNPFEPFTVEFLIPSKENGKVESFTAQYDDPHFQFFAEVQSQPTQCLLYSAVHYKTPQGMVYFWLIYPFHVFVFRSLLKELIQTSV